MYCASKIDRIPEMYPISRRALYKADALFASSFSSRSLFAGGVNPWKTSAESDIPGSISDRHECTRVDYTEGEDVDIRKV